MIYPNIQPAMPTIARGAMNPAYTHLGNSWSAFPAFCSLLAFIAAIKNAKDAALPTITAAAIWRNPTIFMQTIMRKTAKKSMGRP